MAKEFPIVDIVDGIPTFAITTEKMWETCECKKGGVFKYLSPLEYHTERQRRWYKGVCIPELVENDQNGETAGWWDTEVKKQCNGLALLKKEIFILDDGIGIGRLTIRGVGKKNMTLFIEEILSKSMELGWPVSPPNPNLRKM